MGKVGENHWLKSRGIRCFPRESLLHVFFLHYHRRHVKIGSRTSGWYLKHTNEAGLYLLLPLLVVIHVSLYLLWPPEPFHKTGGDVTKGREGSTFFGVDAITFKLSEWALALECFAASGAPAASLGWWRCHRGMCLPLRLESLVSGGYPQICHASFVRTRGIQQKGWEPPGEEVPFLKVSTINLTTPQQQMLEFPNKWYI